MCLLWCLEGQGEPLRGEGNPLPDAPELRGNGASTLSGEDSVHRVLLLHACCKRHAIPEHVRKPSPRSRVTHAGGVPRTGPQGSARRLGPSRLQRHRGHCVTGNHSERSYPSWFRPYLYICAYVACVHMGMLQGQEQSTGLGAAEKRKVRKTRKTQWISVTAIV